jgi:DNA-directed RNA polymerase specialized sigma24 family protein
VAAESYTDGNLDKDVSVTNIPRGCVRNFLRLLTNRASIHGNIGAWLYRVTVNICNAHYRQRRQTLELLPNTAALTPSPDYLFRLKERERLLTENLGVLTNRERAAVIMQFIGDYSTAEVGELPDRP